jgi:hypothetical protein
MTRPLDEAAGTIARWAFSDRDPRLVRAGRPVPAAPIKTASTAAPGLA